MSVPALFDKRKAGALYYYPQLDLAPGGSSTSSTSESIGARINARLRAQWSSWCSTLPGSASAARAKLGN